jgi:uncharacterized SAM-binding protein YcdF (DUF218 family)
MSMVMYCAKKCGLFLLIAFAAAALGAAAGLGYVAEWLSVADQAQRADAILVLGGNYARSFQAADLYRQGYAGKVYVSVVARSDEYRLLDQAGVAFPHDEEVTREVLLKKGVPAAAIAYFGKDSVSTAAEAQAARALFAGGAPKLLIVTSAYHLRRARMIFTDALPAADIRMIATGYDPFPQAWWKDQNAARNVLLELAKITFYKLGGRF